MILLAADHRSHCMPYFGCGIPVGHITLRQAFIAWDKGIELEYIVDAGSWLGISRYPCGFQAHLETMDFVSPCPYFDEGMDVLFYGTSPSVVNSPKAAGVVVCGSYRVSDISFPMYLPSRSRPDGTPLRVGLELDIFPGHGVGKVVEAEGIIVSSAGVGTRNDTLSLNVAQNHVRWIDNGADTPSLEYNRSRRFDKERFHEATNGRWKTAVGQAALHTLYHRIQLVV